MIETIEEDMPAHREVVSGRLFKSDIVCGEHAPGVVCEDRCWQDAAVEQVQRPRADDRHEGVADR